MRTLGTRMNLPRPQRIPRTASAPAPVSVVVPCFRCSDTIGAAVASIAAQRRRPAEVLLVDDASGDGTLDTLHRVAAAYPAGWVKVIASSPNGGPSRARNLGWQQAQQPYIAFLDADDTWAPDKLALQMAELERDPRIALIAHGMKVASRGTAPAPVRGGVRARVIGRRRLLLNNPFPTASVILRRDLPFRFDERFRRVEDFLLWAQISFSGYRCVKLDQVLAYWHKPTFGAAGLSGDLDAMHRAGKDVRRELLAAGLVTRGEHWFARAVGLVRRGRRRVLMLLRPAATR